MTTDELQPKFKLRPFKELDTTEWTKRAEAFMETAEGRRIMQQHMNNIHNQYTKTNKLNIKE